MTILKIFEANDELIGNFDSGVVAEFKTSVVAYEDMGIVVEQYSMSETPDAFENDLDVKRLISEKGVDTLLYIHIDRVLKMVGNYTTASELGVLVGLLEDGSGCTPPAGGCGSCNCGC